MENVFAFWEGSMPAYIQMCINTWKFPYTLLNYDNISKYTDWKLSDNLRRCTLPQIADYVRVHVLRDNGGYWLDTDTIALTEKLPVENIIGNPAARTNSIGFLHTEKGSDMFRQWAEYQDRVITDPNSLRSWAALGNAFTDTWVKYHPEILIYPTDKVWAEVYTIKDKKFRYEQYTEFYFNRQYRLSDIKPTKLLCLHNSWTPTWYKSLSKEEVLAQSCTLSNILKEVL